MSDIVTTSTNSGITTEIDLLKQENERLTKRLGEAILFRENLAFSPYIDGPPVPDGNAEHLYAKACSSDHLTASTWHKQWVDQITANKARYDFWKYSVMSEYAKYAYRPCIIAGSGPSLKKNAALLANKELRGDIPVVSCLHNFGYFEDLGVDVDYYVNLDAGQITVPEMSQGGNKKDEEHYLECSKKRTLVTAFTAYPELLEKWRGDVKFYACIASTREFVDALKQITDFNVAFGVGGNTLGACLYFAKAILGANPIIYIGADFSFSYDNHFHSWNSPYDVNVAGTQRCWDCFGLPTRTWPSYFNFKCYFDYIACGGKGHQPGDYINCTEGGILGAYQEGNIRQIKQASLYEILWVYNLHRKMPEILKDKVNYPLLF